MHSLVNELYDVSDRDRKLVAPVLGTVKYGMLYASTLFLSKVKLTVAQTCLSRSHDSGLSCKALDSTVAPPSWSHIREESIRRSDGRNRCSCCLLTADRMCPRLSVTESERRS